jgi:branched-chain amino acid transport system permease protein
MIIEIFNFVAAGIMTGGIYALLGLGISLVFGVMRVINVAHGDMLTLGAYAAIFFGAAIAPGPTGAIIAALATTAFIGLVIAAILIRPITRDGSIDERQGLVLTLGVSMFLANAVLAIFGPDYHSVPGKLASGSIHIGDLVLEGQRLIILIASLIITALLMTFLRFSATGMAIQAVSENPDAAMASGIDISRIHLLTFTIGSVLAGTAGALIAPVTYAFPAMGFDFTLYAFIVVVIGGLGSLWGALAAAYLYGIAESLGVLWMPSGYNALIGPLMMLLILIFRPQGLLGRVIERT